MKKTNTENLVAVNVFGKIFSQLTYIQLHKSILEKRFWQCHHYSSIIMSVSILFANSMEQKPYEFKWVNCSNILFMI